MLDGIALGAGLGINDGLELGTGVVGNFVGLGEGINDGDREGSRVVGSRVGLGEGITDGLPVGRGVGLLVGSQVVQVRVNDVVRPPVVIPISYVVQVSVTNGGVLIQSGCTNP